MNPDYELQRIRDEHAFAIKMRRKRALYKLFGDIYIGRRVKFAYFRRWLKRIPLPQGARVLEVGSGDGVYAFFVAAQRPGAQVTGIELNGIEARVCQSLAAQEGRGNLKFVEGLLDGGSWADQFDLLYCLDVLEHIPDDRAALREMYMAVAPGGSILVHVPNRVYMETDGRMISVPDEEAWRINPGHVRQGYSPDELRARLTEVGFTVQEVQQTQGRPIAYAHKLYARIERLMPLRIAILPALDVLTFWDMRRVPEHGNTVWAWAKKPV